MPTLSSMHTALSHVLHESSKDVVPRANLSGARSHAHLEHAMSALWDVWSLLQREKECAWVVAGRGVPSESLQLGMA